MLTKGTFWGAVVIALVAVVWYRSQIMSDSAGMLKQGLRVAFVTGGSGPYWQITADGAQAAAADYNVELTVAMPLGSENIEHQMQNLLQVALDNPDGIVISPVDAERLTRSINRISDKSIVVTFDSDAPFSNRQSYIGTNNLAAGRLCAELVKEAIPDGGKVAVLVANLSKYNLVERKQGFADELARKRIVSDEADPAAYEVIDYLLDDGDDEKCAENIRSVLSANPDVKCMVGMNARHGPILIEVLSEAGKLDQIKLVTFDDAPETLAGIAEGHVHATVAQDPYKYGYEAVRMLATLCRKGESELPVVGGGSVSVTVYADAIRKDNLDEYRDRVQVRKQAIADSDEKDDAA